MYVRPAVVHSDPTRVEALIRRLTDRHETGTQRWSVDDAPAAEVDGVIAGPSRRGDSAAPEAVEAGRR